MDYKPNCGFYERFIPSAFVKRGLQEWDSLRGKKKGKANIFTLRSQLAASEGMKMVREEQVFQGFFTTYFNDILNSLKRKTEWCDKK